MDLLKTLLKQPYRVIALIIGAALVVAPCVTIDKDHHWTTHRPATWLRAMVGLALLLVSTVEFAVHLLRMKTRTEAGLDLRRVQESKGILFKCGGL